MTPRQRKRLAEEMRKLAMECLTNGPALHNDWCGCAIGLPLKRAGLQPKRWVAQQKLGMALERMLDPEAGVGHAILSEATCQRIYYDNPTAVVVPLLALADALEDAAQAAKENP